jgi:hypothetical protein
MWVAFSVWWVVLLHVACVTFLLVLDSAITCGFCKVADGVWSLMVCCWWWCVFVMLLCGAYKVIPQCCSWCNIMVGMALFWGYIFNDHGVVVMVSPSVGHCCYLHGVVIGVYLLFLLFTLWLWCCVDTQGLFLGVILFQISYNTFWFL